MYPLSRDDIRSLLANVPLSQITKTWPHEVNDLSRWNRSFQWSDLCPFRSKIGFSVRGSLVHKEDIPYLLKFFGSLDFKSLNLWFTKTSGNRSGRFVQPKRSVRTTKEVGSCNRRFLGSVIWTEKYPCWTYRSAWHLSLTDLDLLDPSLTVFTLYSLYCRSALFLLML